MITHVMALRCVIFTCFFQGAISVTLNQSLMSGVVSHKFSTAVSAIRPVARVSVCFVRQTGVSSQCGASSSCVSATLRFNSVTSDH